MNIAYEAFLNRDIIHNESFERFKFATLERLVFIGHFAFRRQCYMAGIMIDYFSKGSKFESFKDKKPFILIIQVFQSGLLLLKKPKQY